MVHHKPFLVRQAAQFLFLKIIPQNPLVSQQLLTNPLVLATPTLQKRRVTIIPDVLGGLAITVTVAALPSDNSILPSVLPHKRLDNFLELLLLFPFLPIIIVKV